MNYGEYDDDDIRVVEQGDDKNPTIHTCISTHDNALLSTRITFQQDQPEEYVQQDNQLKVHNLVEGEFNESHSAVFHININEDQEGQQIEYSQTTKPSFNHTYQNLGTRYFNFLNQRCKEIHFHDQYDEGILLSEYISILEQAKAHDLFKTKTEIINLHLQIMEESPHPKNTRYLDLMTRRLGKYKDLSIHEKAKKFNSFSRLNKKYFFKEFQKLIKEQTCKETNQKERGILTCVEKGIFKIQKILNKEKTSSE